MGFDEFNALKRDLASEVLRSSGSLRLRVSGWSMLPLIGPGDVIVIEHLKETDIEVGDIVVFRLESRFVAHRVLEKNGRALSDWILTQGDALATPDAPIKRHQILGKVSSVLRRGRCFDPTNSRRRREQVLATLLRRSPRTARAMARVHGVLQRLSKSS